MGREVGVHWQTNNSTSTPSERNGAALPHAKETPVLLLLPSDDSHLYFSSNSLDSWKQTISVMDSDLGHTECQELEPPLWPHSQAELQHHC